MEHTFDITDSNIQEAYDIMDDGQLYTGKDDEGNMTISQKFVNYILVQHFQDNGWIRNEYIYLDGMVENMYSKS